VKTQRPITSEEEHRVLEFRPRSAARPPGPQRNLGAETSHKDAWHKDAWHKDAWQKHARQKDSRQEPNDLSRYERDREEPGDFRHRMLANIAALAFTIALTAIGIWLAMSIADLRNTQDCVLMGRRDCARISTPHI
jgi:hypothetical protein